MVNVSRKKISVIPGLALILAAVFCWVAAACVDTVEPERNNPETVQR